MARQVAVKVSYGLWMTQAEKNAIATVLSSCPNEPLPGGVVAAVPQPAPTATPAPKPTACPCARPRSGTGTGTGTESGGLLRELHSGPSRRRGSRPHR